MREVIEVTTAIDIIVTVETAGEAEIIMTHIDIIVENTIDIEMDIMTHRVYQMRTDLCLLDYRHQMICSNLLRMIKWKFRYYPRLVSVRYDPRLVSNISCQVVTLT